jgi:hypothetical protein
LDTVSAGLGGAVARLNQGELLIVVGTGLIVLVSFLLFGLIFNNPVVSDIQLLCSLALLGLVWLQVAGRHDFGTHYRLFTAGLALVLVVVVGVPLLYMVRGGLGGLNLSWWLAYLSLWAGAAIAGVGGWLLWAGRR